MKNFFRTLAALSFSLFFVLLCSVHADAASVKRSSQALNVDGNTVQCDVYNIDGSNYFKLRDMAKLLNGTGSQFSVKYSEAAKCITITNRKAYEPDGSELVIGADKSYSARKSAQSILIDGVPEKNLSVYNIGGNNYFKLRDLGMAIGFDVDYDNATRTMLVKSLPFDSRQDAAMCFQMGNLSFTGVSAESEDAVYYILKERNEKADQTHFVIIERTDDGKTRDIFSSNDRIESLSVDLDGGIYFISAQTKLIRFDLKTGSQKTICSVESGKLLDSYFRYDNKWYLQIKDRSGDNCQMRQVEDSGASKVLLSYQSSENTDFYAYNGKLFYCGASGYSVIGNTSVRQYKRAFCAYDLATGKTETLIDLEEQRKDGSVLKTAYCSGSFYFTGSEDGKPVIKKVRLDDVQNIRTICAMPQEATQLYPKMYANGNTVFFQCSGAWRLWKVSEAEGFVPIMSAHDTGFEASFVNRQCAVMMKYQYLCLDNMDQVTVRFPNAAESMYLGLLNRTYLEHKADCFAAVQEVRHDDFRTGEELSYGPVRTYRNSAGLLVTEIRLTNQSTKVLECSFVEGVYRDSDSEFTSGCESVEYIQGGGSKTISLILSPEISAALDLNSLSVEIRIYGPK